MHVATGNLMAIFSCVLNFSTLCTPYGVLRIEKLTRFPGSSYSSVPCKIGGVEMMDHIENLELGCCLKISAEDTRTRYEPS